MKIYVVTIVCTLDDVIAGCFFDRVIAEQRLDDCVTNPGIRFEYKDVQGAVDSNPTSVRLTCYEGTKGEKLEEVLFV